MTSIGWLAFSDEVVGGIDSLARVGATSEFCGSVRGEGLVSGADKPGAPTVDWTFSSVGLFSVSTVAVRGGDSRFVFLLSPVSTVAAEGDDSRFVSLVSVSWRTVGGD